MVSRNHVHDLDNCALDDSAQERLVDTKGHKHIISNVARTRRPLEGTLIKKKVLVVDDEPDNRDMLVSVVQDVAGHQATAAADGEQALAAVAADAPDLVLLDLMLPGVSGFEVAQRLKSNPATSDVVILAISALTRTGDREQALLVGCDDYIDKPFNLDDLVAKINQLLGLPAASTP